MRHLLCCVFAIAMAACATDTEPTTESRERESIVESALTCTPGEQMCDYACYYVGGPSSNDCIIQCNRAGTGFLKIQDCGWAQNFPYSSSCRDRPQGPVCEWN